jgi:hypothetical protein
MPILFFNAGNGIPENPYYTNFLEKHAHNRGQYPRVSLLLSNCAGTDIAPLTFAVCFAVSYQKD